MDVEIKIRERQKELRFFNIFGNLARQRLLASTIRHTCSSLRNSYRELVSATYLFHPSTDTSKLRDSVIGHNTTTLDDLVINLANRFVATRASLGRPFVVHVAILVRIFFWQH